MILGKNIRYGNETADSLSKLGASGVTDTYFGKNELPKSTVQRWVLDTLRLPNWSERILHVALLWVHISFMLLKEIVGLSPHVT